MQVLADANFLIDLWHESRSSQDGPCARFLEKADSVWVNVFSVAQFLASGDRSARVKMLAVFRKLPPPNYGTARLAATIYHRRRTRKMDTADAFYAADAILNKLQLVTSDKDFSGVPGLKWVPFRKPSPKPARPG